MIRTNRRVRLCVLALVLNLAFIWGNSLMSAEVSQAFSDWVRNLLNLTPREGTAEGPDLIRKLAHFTEFATLGFLLAWLSGMLGERGVHLWTTPLLTGLLCACLDETIQTMVPERGPSVIDVWVDTCGVAAGMTMLILGYHFLRNRKKT